MEGNVLVLGIGNLLWADDGFGVRAVQALQRQWRFPQQVTLMDGGTQGLRLLPYLQSAQRLIVFDAIDYGLPAGTLMVLSNEQVPRFMGVKKLSLHQTGFQEVLAVAELTGHAPAEVVLIGVQPAAIEDYGADLHVTVQAQIPHALEISLTYLRRWGIEPELRGDPPEAMGLLAPNLAMAACTAGLPRVEPGITERGDGKPAP